MGQIEWDECPYCNFLYLQVDIYESIEYCPLCGYYYHSSWAPNGQDAVLKNLTKSRKNTPEGTIYYIGDKIEYNIKPSKRMIAFANSVANLANNLTKIIMNKVDDIIPFFKGHTIKSDKSFFCHQIIQKLANEKFK